MCPPSPSPDGRFAVGASGGRRILPAVLQIASFLIDHGMSLEDAFHQPRLDVSGPDLVTADERLPFAYRDAGGRPVPPAAPPAQPAAVRLPHRRSRRHGVAGWREGMTEPMQPWADAVAEA